MINLHSISNYKYVLNDYVNNGDYRKNGDNIM